MPVDASPYVSNIGAPQTVDPLATVGKVLQVQQGALALQSAGMEMRARQALGPILQQSIDPKTGELDINKFLLYGAADPDVAWKMPEITLQMIQRQNTQADTVIKQLEANKIRYGAMGNAAAALVADGEAQAQGKVNIRTGMPGTPGVSQRQLVSTLSGMIGENGLLDSKDAAEIAARTATMSDAQRFQFLKTFANSARDIEKVSADTYGTITAHGYGGGTALYQNRPMIGPPRQVGNIEQTPTPGELNAPQAGVGLRGQPTMQPRVQAAPMYSGSGAVVQGSGQGGPALNTGLSPNEQKLQEERAKTANDYETSLVEANTVGQENLRVLREMQTAMKEFKTGGGMEVRQRLAQLAQGLGMPTKLVDEIAGGNRGALAEFQKLAVRYATQEMKTNMGSAQRFTNLDFSTFLKNNPTIDTDPRGLEKMFKFLEQGVWRAGQQMEYYNRWKQGERPRGFEGMDMSSFPAFWTKVLEKVNAPAGAR